MDYPFPTWLDNSFQREIWIAIGWSVAEVGVSVAQGYEMIGIYKGVMVPAGRETEFLTGWKVMCAGGSGSGSLPGPSESPVPLERSGYFEELEDVQRHMPHRVDNTELNIVEEDAEVAIGLRRRYLGRSTSAAAIRLQLEQDLDQLLALKAREEVEEVYGIPAIVCSIKIYT
jgi:hypothetical protein